MRRAFALGEQVNGQARYFTTDHLGSVRDVTDASATLLAQYTFDPWGRRTVKAGADVTSVGYTGHRRHEASGLALALYRGYDEGLARWVSNDFLGDGDGPNRYAYVANEPLRWVDSLGLWKTSGTAPPGALTIVCDGNGNVTTQTTAGGTAQQQKCFGDCTVRHERSHKEDVDRAAQGICKGKQAGTQVWYSNERERNYSERKACRFELRCLRSKLGNCECDALVKQRIATVEGYCAAFE